MSLPSAVIAFVWSLDMILLLKNSVVPSRSKTLHFLYKIEGKKTSKRVRALAVSRIEKCKKKNTRWPEPKIEQCQKNEKNAKKCGVETAGMCPI